MKIARSNLLGLSLFCLMTSTAMAQPVEFSILGTIKPEVATQFDAVMQDYNAAQSNYVIKSIPHTSTTSSTFAKLTTLYASKNAPTLMTLASEIDNFQQNLMDLGNTDLAKKAFANTLNYATRDGVVYGVPVTIEAFGFIYNKAILDKAVGGTFDPESIKTRDDLSNLFDEIKNNTDATPVTISPMDWSLGAHYTNVFFTNTADDLSGKLKVLSDLKAGTYNLKSNKTYSDWLDTFDLMMANNIHADSPLSPTYDDGALDLATGEVGLWFQGNWTYPLLKEINPDGEYGILPVPINNDASRPGNTAISIGVPSYFSIDISQSTPEQRAGAIDFVNWLYQTPEGQAHVVTDMDFIPVYKGTEVQPKNGLSQMVMKYAESDRSLDWINLYYPSEAYSAMGASMQKYLAGVVDRDGLADEIEEYWASAK